MRFYDELLHSTTTDAHKSQLREAVVLNAQNVSDWWDAHVERTNTLPVMGSDVVKCIPPWRVSFVEFKVGPEKHGVLTVREDLKGGGWRLHVQFWHSGPERNMVYLRRISAQVAVSAEGTESLIWSAPDEPQFITALGKEENTRALWALINTALLAFRLSHARGIKVVERLAPRHERRRAERTGEPAPTKYYTLEIGPVTRVLETEGRIKEVGLVRALHLCRGHFADYTQGAGLFGKYNVEVFVPDHVRGRRDRGEIIKDYSLGAP